jgi:hypothetical protein
VTAGRWTRSIPRAVKPRSFFDAFPLFYETRLKPVRLGTRHQCLIADRAHLIRGRKVIDLGSRDGRRLPRSTSVRRI